MDWLDQTETAINKSARVLGMLKRCLKGPNLQTQLTLYKTLIRPVLEYASCAWAPYKQAQIDMLEKIQRRSVRWVAALGRTDSVTEAMNHLAVQSLKQRRADRDLRVLEQMKNGEIDVNISEYYSQNTSYNTRRNIIHLTTNKTQFTNSFIPRVTRLMN